MPYFDYHEPEQITQQLATQGWEQRGLNDEGYADYMWTASDGVEVHVERKTWGELSDLDKVEEQLYRHLTKNPNARLVFLLEGVVTPAFNGYVTYAPTVSKNRIMFYANRTRHLPMSMFDAWLYRIGKYLEVFRVSTSLASLHALSAMYKSDQKPDDEHTTFRRYYKQVSFEPNPQVAKLISIGDGLGPVRAEAIINRFGTCWNVLTATPQQLAGVDGVGMQTANKLLRSIGRPDV